MVISVTHHKIQSSACLRSGSKSDYLRIRSVAPKRFTRRFDTGTTTRFAFDPTGF
jgi:hypothetical protein